MTAANSESHRPGGLCPQWERNASPRERLSPDRHEQGVDFLRRLTGGPRPFILRSFALTRSLKQQRKESWVEIDSGFTQPYFTIFIFFVIFVSLSGAAATVYIQSGDND